MEKLWNKYRKNGIQEMRPYVEGEDLSGVSISEKDIPSTGGMLARGKDGSRWYVCEDFFKENYELVN